MDWILRFCVLMISVLVLSGCVYVSYETLSSQSYHQGIHTAIISDLGIRCKKDVNGDHPPYCDDGKGFHLKTNVKMTNMQMATAATDRYIRKYYCNYKSYKIVEFSHRKTQVGMTNSVCYTSKSRPYDENYSLDYLGRYLSNTSIPIYQIKKMMIQRSIQSYPGSCPCPYSIAQDGYECGKRSAYSKPGGDSPLCYSSEIICIPSTPIYKYYKKLRFICKK